MKKTCYTCAYFLGDNIVSHCYDHCVNFSMYKQKTTMPYNEIKGDNNMYPKKRNDYLDAFRYALNNRFGSNYHPTHIKNVIFNDPATIIFWSDGTKTVVKTQNGENFDPEKGLAMAIAKKAFGNEGYYYNVIKKWLDKSKEPSTSGEI